MSEKKHRNNDVIIIHAHLPDRLQELLGQKGGPDKVIKEVFDIIEGTELTVKSKEDNRNTWPTKKGRPRKRKFKKMIMIGF